MHEVMTGFFKPNSADSNRNLTASFATTNNIINGVQECGQGIGVNREAKDRASFFLAWLNYFGLPAESDIDCGNQGTTFPSNGYGGVPIYFDRNWDDRNECEAVKYMT